MNEIQSIPPEAMEGIEATAKHTISRSSASNSELPTTNHK